MASVLALTEDTTRREQSNRKMTLHIYVWGLFFYGEFLKSKAM